MPPNQIVVLATTLLVVLGQTCSVVECGLRARTTNRLLQNVKPLEYDLRLRVDPKQVDSFVNGSVDIYVEFLPVNQAFKERSSQTLSSLKIYDEQLHTIALKKAASVAIQRHAIIFDSSLERLKQGRGRPLELAAANWDEKSELLAFESVGELPAGSFGRIFIEFANERHANVKRRKSAPSFAPISAANKEGRSFTNARFEPSFAHHVFPCFDAPQFSSRFKLIVDTDRNFAVHSNMPPVSRAEFGANLARTIFQQSPPMPVHSLALSIGDYEQSGPIKVGELDIRVTVPRGKIEASHFALDIAEKSAKWLFGTLETALPIRKLDIIATELGQYNSTESLGCVLLKQDFILIHDGESAPERKIITALNVAYSTAQQWFGNLVSPKRWFDSWITDGLAAHLAIEMLEEFAPDLGARNYVRSHLLPRALRLKASRSMRDPSIKAMPGEESSLVALEPIKNASIMSMLQDLIGRSELYAAAKTLLKQTSGLVEMERFTAVLSEATGNKMTQAQLETYLLLWRDHPSFPLISVTHDDGQVVIFQSNIEHAQVLKVGSTRLASFHEAVQMRVRLVFASHSGTEREIVELPLDAFKEKPSELNPRSGLVRVPLPDWFDLNSADSGHWLKIVAEPEVLPFYRVRYADDLLERMKPAMASMRLADKISLLNDANVLVQLGNNILPKPPSEIITWFETAHGEAAILVEMLQAKQSEIDTIGMTGFVSLALDRLAACRWLFDSFGFSERPGETVFEQFARGLALSDLVNDDDRQVIGAALAAFDERGPTLAPFLKAPIYAAVGKAGSSEQIDKLYALINGGPLWSEELQRLEFAIAQTFKPEIVRQINSMSKWFRGTVNKVKPAA